MINKHEIGSLILRLALGIIFFFHGFDKFQGGIENTFNYFEGIGIYGLFAYIVPTIEVVGGMALILGLETRIAASLITIIMLVAIIYAKASSGFLNGFEFEFVLLAVSVHLAINGSNAFSLDAVFHQGRKSENKKIA